jgi:hypothetical protein
MDHHTVAAVSITGACVDVLSVVFGIGYGLDVGLFFGLASGIATGITLSIEFNRATRGLDHYSRLLG